MSYSILKWFLWIACIGSGIMMFVTLNEVVFSVAFSIMFIMYTGLIYLTSFIEQYYQDNVIIQKDIARLEKKIDRLTETVSFYFESKI